MANIEDLRDRSVSSGTLKSEDLIPKFLGVLKTYGKDKYDKYIKENPEVEDWENLDEETMGWVVDELTDLLNEIAPDGCYFGASEGDGADYGFWSMSNESKKSEVSSLAAFDIEDVVGKKLGWTWDDDKSCLVDKDGTEVGWDESDCITIDPVEDENGNVLTQVNMWGDGTVEFQDENGESVNWTEFDDATVKKVVAVLGGKSEGNDDDKGCKGKDCKDDKTKKNEADATFKVGDLVNYDAESDGKDVYDSFIPCEVVDVNDDGTLGLCVYGSYVNEEGLGENASASCCSKLDHYAGMVDANHYYMDGKYNAYKGGWEILITDKELNPKVYEFIGTIDDLSEVIDIDDFYGGENFVYDEDLRDDLGATGVDTDGVDFADMSGNLARASGSPEESKKNNESYDWIAFYFCKDKRSGAEYAVIPQDRLFIVGNGGGRYNLSYIDANGHWDRLSYGYFATSCEPISNPENSKVYATVKADEDRRIIALTESEFDTIADSDDAVKTVKSIVANNYESKKSEARPSYYNHPLLMVATAGGKTIYSATEDGDIMTDDENEAYVFRNFDIISSIAEEDFLKVAKHYLGKNAKVDYIPAKEMEESKKSEDTKVGKFTIMPKDTSRKQAGIRAYQTRLGEMGFKSNLHNNGDYIHDCVKEIGKIPGATVYVGTIDNFQKNTQEYQYEAELYMENENGIRSNIEYMPFAITDISDGMQRKMYFNRLNALIKKGTDFVNNHESSESHKKSESLTLKQKELKDMARFGQAEDITTISDEEAKALRKKGIETIGVSRGTYGMNGALLRDNEGKKYVITARSSNLFYFV